MNVHLIDVELPDGHRFEHHALRLQPVAATVVIDESQRVLLLWRHRFITNTWGWEIPMGIVEDGETPMQTAAREAEEETGWRPGPLKPLICYEPSNGISDSRHYLFRADGATHQGAPVDATESDRIEWIALSEISQLIASGELCDGPTLVGLLHMLAFPSSLRRSSNH